MRVRTLALDQEWAGVHAELLGLLAPAAPAEVERPRRAPAHA